MNAQDSEAPAFARYTEYGDIYMTACCAEFDARQKRMSDMQDQQQAMKMSVTPAARNQRSMSTRKSKYGASAHTPDVMKQKNNQQ